MAKNKDLLKMYKEKLRKNKAEKSGIQPVKSFEFNVPSNLNSFKLKVFDSLNIGSDGKNTCSINELISHIDYVEKTENCYAILGGDLFYCFDKQEKMGDTTFDTEKQLEILTQLFSPIKHKIIGIIGGKSEQDILRKEGVEATGLLAERLNLSDRFNPYGLIITANFKNSYTDKLPLSLDITCSSVNTKAQLYATVYRRSLQAGKRIGSADINITTGTRRSLKADSKIHDYSTRLGDLIRKPHYEYTSSGYCMWGKKGEGPYFIDNNILSIYIAKNKDAEIIQGTNEIKEVPYKVFCDIEPIGKEEFTKKQYNIIADYYALRTQNDDLIDSIINSLQDLKKDLNNSSQKSLFEGLDNLKEEKEN